MKLIKYLLVLAMLWCCQHFFVACNDQGDLGLDLVNNSNVDILQTDTFTLISQTIREDSIITGFNPILETYPSTFLLGSTASRKYGKTQAGFYAQARLPRAAVEFEDNVTLDSIVLALAYGGAYGDTLTAINVKVYELEKNLSIDTLYYSNIAPQVDLGNPLADITFSPRPFTRIKYFSPDVDTSSKAEHLPLRQSQIRIPLDNALGQKFLDASGTNDLSDNTAFLDFFKGIFVVAEYVDQQGSIMSVDLLSAVSLICLYYTELDSGESIPHIFNFVINANSVRANYFRHDYSNSRVGENLNNPQNPNNNVYIQGLAGLKTKIEFPYIRNLVDSGQKVAINRAELVFPVVNPSSQYQVPPEAFVALSDSLGRNDLLPFQSEQIRVFNTGSQQYRINITGYMQQLVYSDKDFGVFLIPLSSSTNPSRATIRSANSLHEPLKLNLTYTILE